MTFHTAKLRVKELAETLGIDVPEIIATCALLNIPASSPLSSLTVEDCKRIIDYLKVDVEQRNNDNHL